MGSPLGHQHVDELENTASVHDSARQSTSFLSAATAVTALRSTGAPGLAYATRISIVCSARLSTRGETRVPSHPVQTEEVSFVDL
jgi:hypothetical protein